MKGEPDSTGKQTRRAIPQRINSRPPAINSNAQDVLIDA
jgi:hypothetical protein